MKKMLLTILIALLVFPISCYAEPISTALLNEEFAGSIQDAILFENGMAVMGSKGLFLWQPDSGESTQILAASAYPEAYGMAMCARQNELLLLDSTTGSFYQVADGQANMIGQLPEDVFFYDDRGDLTPKTIISCLAVEDKLYLLLNSFTFENGDTYELYIVESDCQTVAVVEAGEIRILWSTDGENLLIGQLADGVLRPCLYDPKNQNVLRVWEDVDAAQGIGFVFDSDSDMLYYTADSGKVYAKAEGKSATICAYMPFKYQYSSDKGLLWNSQTYAYLGSGSLFLREIQQGGATAVTLNIMGTPDADILMQFAAQHPDISINLQNRTEDILSLQQSMVAADGSIDLYIIASDGVYADVQEKGYAAALNDSDVLMSYVASYYPWVQETLMLGEQLIAVPASVSVEHWTLNRTRWQALGLGEAPSTLGELFTISEVWQDEYADDYAGYCLFDCRDGLEGVLQDIIRQYLLEHETWEAPVTFDTAEFREVVAAAWEHRDTFVSAGDDNPLLMNYPQYFGTGWNDEDVVASFVPPALTESSPQVIRGTMDLFILSPASKHKAEALIFLEFYAANLNNTTKCRLDSSCSEPIRASWYEAAHQARLDQIAALQLQLNDTEDAGDRRDIESSIEILQEQDQRSQENEWEISVEDIAIYHDIAAHVMIPLRTIYPKDNSAKTQSIDDVVSRFASGQITIDEFVRQLDEKARMIYSEMR